MKQKVILSSILIGAAIVGSAYSGGPAHGGLGNRTGSGGSTLSCSQGGCHGAESGMLVVTLSLTDDADGTLVTDGQYLPGHIYTVKLSGAYSGTASYTHLGFQASSVNASGAQFGTIDAIETNTGTSVAAGRTLIEHTAPRPKTGDLYEVTFRWTAPAAGGGDVRFFARMLANNNNGNNSDDTPAAVQATFTEGAVTSLPELDAAISTVVYPNPATQSLSVELGDAAKGAWSFRISDLTGRNLLREEHQVNAGNYKASMDISHLVPGMYVLQLSHNGQARQVKFVKK